MNININGIIKTLIPFLILTLVAYILNSLLYIYLPKSSPSIIVQKKYNMEYRKYLVNKNFKEKQQVMIKEIKQKIVQKEYELISNISLKAIYSSSIETNGWITIVQNNSSKTYILSVGEIFKKYKLIKVLKEYAIFKKDEKEYKLSISDTKKEPRYTMEEEEELVKESSVEEIDGIYSIKREEINLYKNDFSKIWKDISIIEIKKDGKIDGFRINRISSKSVFEDLGLRKGDIIKSVNNVTLKSYADALSLYKKINKMDSMQFTILRNNEMMEMEYEIK
jgi:general secretion pathway protein C